MGKNKYLLETTGCGLAFYDYDNDGWLDVFLVNGWRLEGFAKGQEPHCHLFKNNRDGTFTDVTKGSGLEVRTGWGQACCVGDYDNDGHDDLFVTYYGQNALYRNNGNGTFTDVTERAGLIQPGPKTRWNTGCTWVDYDRDGHLDLFVANYVDFDLKTAPAARGWSMHLQRNSRRLRSSGAAGRKEHSVSQQRRRHLRRREPEGGDVERGRHLWSQRGCLRSR